MSRYDFVMENREKIVSILKSCNCENPMLFGSVVRKEDIEESDIDILFYPNENTTGFQIARAEIKLSELLNGKVDLVNGRSLIELFRPYIEKEAISLL